MSDVATPQQAIQGSRVEINALHRHFPMGQDLVRAVDDVTLSIESGECVALVGSSGSGKSTLLHLIGGLDVPDEGTLIVDGQALGSLGQRQLAAYRSNTVGFIFQSFHLLHHRTAQENVELPMTVAGLPRTQRRKHARQLLVEVGLEDRLTHRPDQMSGGERQRVAIARALGNTPTLLVADEPTGNLDSVNGDRVMELLFKLCRERGVTLIYATHDRQLAKKADRLVRMRDGKLVTEDEQ
jgi:putative ABC transport system ATP-binding protein